jgi:predicted metal-binding membrane protein
MTRDASVFEVVLRRDRQIVVAGLVTVITLSWLYILLGAGMGMSAFEMTSKTFPGSDHSVGATMQMAHTAMMQPAVWTPGYALLMVVMWWVMMVAMMLPSAIPMLLLFARVNRSQKTQGAPFVPTGVFASGYVVAWGVFSVLAAGLQWGLERVGWLSSMMASTNAVFAGIVLLVAGVYQLTPLKHACLKHCRSPLQFITQHWRTGTAGVFRMGLDHGVFCLACCWFLMALLFVGGVMNLYWIVGLAVLVLLEKTIPAGHGLGSLMGIGLMAWGGWMVAGTFL